MRSIGLGSLSCTKLTKSSHVNSAGKKALKKSNTAFDYEIFLLRSRAPSPTTMLSSKTLLCHKFVVLFSCWRALVSRASVWNLFDFYTSQLNIIKEFWEPIGVVFISLKSSMQQSLPYSINLICNSDRLAQFGSQVGQSSFVKFKYSSVEILS